MFSRLAFVGVLVCSLWMVRAARADEAESTTKIQDLLKANKAEEADKELAAALAEFPESARLNGLRYSLYLAHARDERLPAAVSQLTAYLDYILRQVPERPIVAGTVANYVMSLVSVSSRANGDAVAVPLFDTYLQRLKDADGQRPSGELSEAIGNLTNSKIQWLANNDRAADAKKLMAEELSVARAVAKSKPDDVSAGIRLANALRTELEVAAEFATEDDSVLRKKFLTVLDEQLAKHATDVKVINSFIRGQTFAAATIAPTNPDTAEEILKHVRQSLKDLDATKPGIKALVESTDRLLKSYQRSIDNARQHLSLIGKDSAPLEPAAWLNSMGFSPEDLKGKVVLLDFWAVWCGPCIRTFPHLRAWHEKYASKGLVIVGVTRFYDYDWDAEKKRPKKVADIKPEDELAATAKFLDHHKLTHAIAFNESDSKFAQNYFVQGIPQAVLIDRQGKVRLVRVGSGERNARDLGRMIEQLMAESPAKK